MEEALKTRRTRRPSVRSPHQSLQTGDGYVIARFDAMACPCELLIETSDISLAKELWAGAQAEAKRIEDKFSRYRSGNIVDQINSSQGKPVAVDDETASLLDYAAECYALSDGLFDITTGALRSVWQFSGTEYHVSEKEIEQARQQVGWPRVSWQKPAFQIPIGFQIDFGGIAKEYAADRILALLRKQTAVSMLVNLGGDIAAAGSRTWAVGIEDPRSHEKSVRTLSLREGAVATSGTSKRFAYANGRRVSHILNPKTGRPVENPPVSVTVTATSCTEAGLWSTLGLLHGDKAEAFLKERGVEFWCLR